MMNIQSAWLLFTLNNTPSEPEVHHGEVLSLSLLSHAGSRLKQTGNVMSSKLDVTSASTWKKKHIYTKHAKTILSF